MRLCKMDILLRNSSWIVEGQSACWPPISFRGVAPGTFELAGSRSLGTHTDRNFCPWLAASRRSGRGPTGPAKRPSLSR